MNENEEPEVEETPAPEAPAPEAEAPPEEPAAVDIFGEDAPDTIKVYDEQEDDHSISAADLEGLDPQAMHVLSNFRRAFNRNMQSVASDRKEVEEQRGLMEKMQDQLKSGAEELAQNRLRMLALFQDPRIAEFAKSPEGGPPPDRWSPEGQDYHQRKFFAEQMSQFLGQWNTLSEEEGVKVQQAKQGIDRSRRETELNTFIQGHDDFAEHLPKIRELRAETGNTLSAERAYAIAKAMAAKQVDQVKAARAQARKTVARPPMGGRRATDIMPPPELKTGSEKAKWFAEHPDAQAELYRRIKAGGR